MANRYQDRPFPADGDRLSDQAASARQSDPLAELARLIGQTDPFSNAQRANQPATSQPSEPAWASDEVEDHGTGTPGPLPWMQHRGAQAVPAEPDEAEFIHPVRRYAASPSVADRNYHEAPPFSDPEAHDQSGYDQTAHDPAHAERYDDALYGQMPADPALAGSDAYGDQAYSEDPYAYGDDEDTAGGRLPGSRRGGMMTVVAVLALAVVGTGAAFAYRSYVGSPRSGEPPVIKADTTPNKIVPAPSSDASAKPIQDRLATGNATEKMVSREEQPVDVKDSTKGGPRVVFPALNANGNPPSLSSVATIGAPPQQAAPVAPAGEEPRKIKTFTVHPDQPDGLAAPAARTARASVPARSPSAPAANAPLSLSPQAGNASAPTRVASTSPTQSLPSARSGGYVVQISSQRSEADAQASFRALQGKFPSVLGSRAPLIKRADLGPKGVYYRAMIGPFGSPEDASQFCGSLKSAGGQCVVQRN